MMQTRPLGKTGEHLSALGFGCMGLVGWYGTRNDAEARETLIEAIELGINHLDTAASYQVGENERFVGGVIRDRRDKVFLATKCGLGRGPGGTVLVDNRPETIRSSCDASLGRLGIDHIDLFYLHRIDKTVPVEESAGEMGRLVSAGKIRYVGLSECSAQTLRRAYAVHPIAAVQTEYSLWSRDPEQDILPTCRELGVAFVAYSPLGRGFLAGNFRKLDDLPPDDNRRSQPRFQDAAASHNARIADVIRELAQRKAATPAQIAIAWVLAQGEHIHPIPGMKTRAHLRDNVGALEITLSREELERLTVEVERLRVQGERHPPAMMQAVDR
jgi:aryl-alcohol dehydrogenase-like predicted oxidoreductase